MPKRWPTEVKLTTHRLWFYEYRYADETILVREGNYYVAFGNDPEKLSPLVGRPWRMCKITEHPSISVRTLHIDARCIDKFVDRARARGINIVLVALCDDCATCAAAC
jgi:hypothetical protein